MPYLLALTSALFYGAADFVGGVTARRAETVVVVLVAQFAGLLALALTVPLLSPVSPGWYDLLWGAAAGVAGSAGVALLYRGLAIGTMAIVAPTTAVCAVLVPVAVNAALGEALSRLALAGIALALVGIVLVAQEARPIAPPQPATPDPPGTRSGTEGEAHVPPAESARGWFPRGFGLAVLSGVAIAGFYLSLARASADAGLWPLVVARGASVVLFGVIAMAGGRSLRMGAVAVGMAVGAGALDVVANALYLVATWTGQLSIVVTLTSLYPASTVLLARLFLRERLNTWQVAGVVCALAAVALIVSGG